MSKQRTPDYILSEYNLALRDAHKLCSGLKASLQWELMRNGLSTCIPIESRVKRFGSVAAKLKRGVADIRNLASIEDIIGIRLVFLFQRDVELACEALRSLFAGTKLKPRRSGHDQFGYQSMHLIVQLPEALANSYHPGEQVDYQQCSKLKAEIQLRTIAQHTWASASHHLQYKKETDVPDQLKRTINRLAALIEIVDLEFERVRVERENYRKALESESDDVVLNVDSLEATLRRELGEGYWIEDGCMFELLEDLEFFDLDTRRKLVDFLHEPLVHQTAETTVVEPVDSVESYPEYDYPEDYDDGFPDFPEGSYSPTGVVHYRLNVKYPDRYALLRENKVYEAFKGVDPEELLSTIEGAEALPG
jgi:ppGpp synthetase/RelA/SpoT-type nucleotidyltranferase